MVKGVYLLTASLFFHLLLFTFRVQSALALETIIEDSGQGCEFAGASNDVPSLGCLSQIVVNVVEVMFLFLGAISLLLIFYSAIRFIIARGDPKAIQTAQKTLTYAIIGTVLVLLAFVVVNTFTTMLGLSTNFLNFSVYQGP